MNLEEQYNIAGKIWIRHAPDGFEKAWIDDEIHDDHSKETWDYTKEDGEENWGHIADNKEGIKLTRALRATRDEMHAQPVHRQLEREPFSRKLEGLDALGLLRHN